MQQAQTISTEAINHLSQMAALYGYELKPLLPPVIQMNPGTTDAKTLIKKKMWTKNDTANAIKICEKQGIGKINGLLTFLKYQP